MSDLSWNSALKDYEIVMRIERNLATNTIMGYRRDLLKLSNFSEETLAKKSPLLVTYEDLQEYLYQQNKLGISAKAQSRWISAIKGFFNFLLDEEYIEQSPASNLQAPKLGLYLPDVLSQYEVNKIALSIPKDTMEGQRNYCIIEVLYGCGLRVSELVSLKISHIHFDENFMQVVGKGSKTRLVPLMDFTLELIQNYIKNVRNNIGIHEQHRDTLFLNNRGKGISRISIFNIVKKVAKAAGITKSISPHTFRHSYATHLLQNGADLRFIQEMLGHSSINTTEIYTHLDRRQLRDTILHHHPRNKIE